MSRVVSDNGCIYSNIVWEYWRPFLDLSNPVARYKDGYNQRKGYCRQIPFCCTVIRVSVWTMENSQFLWNRAVLIFNVQMRIKPSQQVKIGPKSASVMCLTERPLSQANLCENNLPFDRNFLVGRYQGHHYWLSWGPGNPTKVKISDPLSAYLKAVGMVWLKVKLSIRRTSSNRV